MKDHGPIDITTLALEPPRAETTTFDPERDITYADWDKIIKEYHRIKNGFMGLPQWPSLTVEEHHRPYIRIADLANMAAAVRLFAPARINELGLAELAPKIKDLLEKHQEYVPYNPMNLYYLEAAFLTTAFGAESPRVGITQKDSTSLKAQIQIFKDSDIWHTLARAALTFTTFFPDRMAELGLDEEKITQQVLRNVKNSKEKGAWLDLAIDAGTLKALFPQKTGAINKELDRITWQRLIQSLHADEPAGIFCERALYLAILAARKVQITDRGIELVFDRSEPFKEQIPPMPPIRKF